MEEAAALVIRRAFPRIPADALERFRGAPTGFIADAQGRRGGLDHRIGPMHEPSAFAGSAVTVRAGPGDNLAAWAALELCGPGDVLAISTGPWLESSVIGDLFAGVARNRGVAAVVTDGLVRDAGGLEAVGLPVFARGRSPSSPYKRGPGEIGHPIMLGGARIESGDLLAGDRDGVVHVPRGTIERVLEELGRIREKEAELERSVAGGLTSAPWLAAALARLGVREAEG